MAQSARMQRLAGHKDYILLEGDSSFPVSWKLCKCRSMLGSHIFMPCLQRRIVPCNSCGLGEMRKFSGTDDWAPGMPTRGENHDLDGSEPSVACPLVRDIKCGVVWCLRGHFVRGMFGRICRCARARWTRYFGLFSSSSARVQEATRGRISPFSLTPTPTDESPLCPPPPHPRIQPIYSSHPHTLTQQ